MQEVTTKHVDSGDRLRRDLLATRMTDEDAEQAFTDSGHAAQCVR